MPPVINEFVFNHTGSDTNEFVEVLGDPLADLSNFWILQIEGDSNASTGSIVSATQLGSTNADGFVTTGFVNGQFQNGSSTLLLVENFTGAVGDDIDAANDGTIDNAPWSGIVDAVAVNDGGAGDLTYAQTVLTAEAVWKHFLLAVLKVWFTDFGKLAFGSCNLGLCRPA